MMLLQLLQSQHSRMHPWSLPTPLLSFITSPMHQRLLSSYPSIRVFLPLSAPLVAVLAAVGGMEMGMLRAAAPADDPTEAVYHYKAAYHSRVLSQTLHLP